MWRHKQFTYVFLSGLQYWLHAVLICSTIHWLSCSEAPKHVTTNLIMRKNTWLPVPALKNTSSYLSPTSKPNPSRVLSFNEQRFMLRFLFTYVYMLFNFAGENMDLPMLESRSWLWSRFLLTMTEYLNVVSPLLKVTFQKS